MVRHELAANEEIVLLKKELKLIEETDWSWKKKKILWEHEIWWFDVWMEIQLIERET